METEEESDVDTREVIVVASCWAWTEVVSYYSSSSIVQYKVRNVEDSHPKRATPYRESGGPLFRTRRAPRLRSSIRTDFHGFVCGMYTGMRSTCNSSINRRLQVQ